ncbi:hydroxyisourate hydrolase [Roseovarius spongiae]|uniref:5-hydroxyisourate hydrolase n=1 Tax=Roseovarius spongiae TaxID=2320272 RepID=A0A3A8ATV7_9RHOB|nr:hydroxyisourate hydrolase [Roseovarius spongiae]RKF14121.1 hydroxyisourate hydrolase [Roseovarius spongiae]
MAGYLTTHVLDTARGVPAQGVRITLFALGEVRRELAQAVTNADGRTNAPILPSDAFAPGEYELLFACGDYLERHGLATGPLKFLDAVPIRFAVSDGDAHYHVPLLLSPFGYSTYRGS